MLQRGGGGCIIKRTLLSIVIKGGTALRKGMKQVLAALLALTMLFGAVGAFAEEDTEISSD